MPLCHCQKEPSSNPTAIGNDKDILRKSKVSNKQPSNRANGYPRPCLCETIYLHPAIEEHHL
jgi:hypothetical protein